MKRAGRGKLQLNGTNCHSVVVCCLLRLDASTQELRLARDKEKKSLRRLVHLVLKMHHVMYSLRLLFKLWAKQPGCL